ncbi:MAG: NmrA family NAD(P)-binding protein [Deltaproteobacteria bacterium]|nr:NmrA family NAD(P)-binding protein [Nannocystaceae bacterium]
MSRILVIGASGAQGRPVARQLAQAGHTVRLFVRDPAKVADLNPDLAIPGAEIVVGDHDDTAALAKAVRGQDGMFLLLPFFGPNEIHARNLIGAAQAAGIRRIVWNATGGIPPNATGSPGVDIRMTIRDALDASGLEWIALQPTVYMENLLGPWSAPELAANDTFAYPIPESLGLQWISHEDAAGFSVAAFAMPGAPRESVRICGPETLTGPQVADSFSRALGRPIRFRAMPPREFGNIMDRTMGGGGDAVAALYEAVAENPDLLATRIDHASLLAHLPIAPVTMEAFARRHAATFSRERELR